MQKYLTIIIYDLCLLFIKFNIISIYVQWKTPWIELAIDEMPRFQQDFSIKLVPTLPKKNENDAENVWNPEKDVKMYVYFLSFILSLKI
jgi:hypothetical protein